MFIVLLSIPAGPASSSPPFKKVEMQRLEKNATVDVAIETHLTVFSLLAEIHGFSLFP